MLAYKELADKLGVKKDTIIYRARKPPDKSIIKKNGINYLTDSAAETISKTIQQKKQTDNTRNTNDTVLTEQLAIKDQQITKLQQLLDQQQQLTANLQNKLETTQQQLTTAETQKTKHWWQKLFS